MPEWTWYGHPVYRFRDEGGRFADQETIWEWGELSMESNAGLTCPLAEQWEAGTLSLSEWEAQMRERIKGEVIRQYLLGIGGVDELTPEHYGRMGGIIADQYRYLDGFVDRIAAGENSVAQIAAYSEMYILSAREAYERANSVVRGLPTMPQYAGNGNCRGLTRCGCRWEYHFRKNKWECFWVVNPAKENCELCLGYASEWGPLIVEVTV